MIQLATKIMDLSKEEENNLLHVSINKKFVNDDNKGITNIMRDLYLKITLEGAIDNIRRSDRCNCPHRQCFTSFREKYLQIDVRESSFIFLCCTATIRELPFHS